MQIQALGRTALLITLSGIAGFLAGRNSTAPPLQVSSISPAPPRALAAEQKTPGTLPQEPKPSEAKSGAAPSSEDYSRSVLEKLSLVLSHLEGAPDREVGEQLADWFAANPDEALAFLATSLERDAVFSQLFALWSKKDPHAASLWLAEHPVAPGRDGMAAGLASGVAAEDPAAAMQWVAAIKDPVIKLNAGREAGWQIYRSSEDNAAAALREAGIPDSAIPTVQASWRKQFTATVSRNAQSLIATVNAAAAAGSTIKASNADDLLNHMATGIKGGGQFKDAMFQVETSNWTSRESNAVKNSISIPDGPALFVPPPENEK